VGGGTSVYLFLTLSLFLLLFACPDARAQSLDVSVVWTRDATVTPNTVQCSRSGDVAGNPTIHLRFQQPSGAFSSSVREIRVHETAGHYDDQVWPNLSFGGQPRPECGDPPPGTPNMLYCDQYWLAVGRHNLNHMITAIVDYYTLLFPLGWETHTVTQQITVSVRNLTVAAADPVNPDPILWNGPGSPPLTIRGTLDAAYRADVPVTLRIYQSSQTLVKTMQQTIRVDGSTDAPFVWDGSQDYPLTGIAPKGVYLFKFDAGPPGHAPGDLDCDKSSLLQITQTRSELTGDYNDATDENTIKDGCVLTDSGNPRASASEANVRVYGMDLAMIAGPITLGTTTNAPGEPNPVWNEATFPLVIQQEETHLFSVRDDHAAQDKGHRQRWALQNNQKPVHPLADNYSEITTAGAVDKTAQSWQKKLWDSATNYRGAYRARANGAATAGFITGALPFDHLMHFWGHGNETGGGVATSTQMIWAHPAYPGQPGCFLSTLNLHDLLLVVWQACDTAKTDSNYGNLLDQSFAQGAACAVGFKEAIDYSNYAGAMNRGWAYAFWQALAQGHDDNGGPNGIPDTVQGALEFAKQRVNEFYGGYYGYDQFATRGNNGLKIVPAR
jgi:hypothetical protein